VLEAEALMNIGPLIRSSEELRSSQAVGDIPGGIEDDRAQFLELRTESGALYVCPSGWERIRLRWVFRHFHVLPPQVLSRRDQRLIEKLARSALVTPALPVSPDRVFGVVESARSQSTPSTRQVFQLKTERVRPQALQAKARTADGSRPELPDRKRLFAVGPGSIPIRGTAAPTHAAREPKTRFVRDARFQQWGALGTLVAVCTVVILLRLCGVPLLPGTAPMRNPPSAPVKRAAIDVKPRVLPSLITVSPPTVLLPSVEKPKLRLPPPAPEPALVAQQSPPPVSDSAPPVSDSSPAAAPIESAVVAPSVAADRLFVSELPQGHFAEPVVTDPRLVGELRLRALIGADGSVKEVTVVSGSPKLAEVGMRAVRRWRYQALGHPGEAETLIRMSFFGQDGVSIASIAK
jgi:Gram-negative bacterial TonB protein C-terminal